jgi:hypothetical protein
LGSAVSSFVSSSSSRSGAPYAGPKTAVGEAVVGFGAVERVGELSLGDVTDEAEVASACLQEAVTVEDAQRHGISGFGRTTATYALRYGCAGFRDAPSMRRACAKHGPFVGSGSVLSFWRMKMGAMFERWVQTVFDHPVTEPEWFLSLGFL